MPTPTYNLIQEITVSGSVTTSVSFTSIPATYDDLVVVCRGKSALDEATGMRFNSDSGTNYSRAISGANTGTATTLATTADTYHQLTIGNENQNYMFTTNIIGYNNSNWRKTLFTQSFTELGALANSIAYTGCQWFSTSTITTITIFTAAGTNFVAGSVFQLYGIKGSN